MSLDEIRRCAERISRRIRSAVSGESWRYALLETQRICRLGEAEDLMKALRTWPGSHEFTGTYRHFGRSAQSLDINDLAEWLLLRASVVDSEIACSELQTYSDGNDYPVLFTLLVGGMEVVRPLDIGAGLRLVPYEPEFFADLGFFDEDSLAHDKTRDEVRQISSAILFRTRHPKVVTRIDDGPGVSPEAARFDDDVYEHLNDARLICGLVEPRDVPRAGHRAQLAVSVPCYLRASYASYGMTDHVSSTGYLYEDWAEAARTLFERFTGLSMADRRRFRIPLERLQYAIHERHTAVEAAIDLGIALESLFLDDSDDAELSYRLSLRAARLLTSNAEERALVRRLFKALYALRSRAVHRGKLDLKAKELAGRTSVDALLGDGIKATACAARKLVEIGGINWSKFDLA